MTAHRPTSPCRTARPRPPRPGFALLVILWVVFGAAVLALAGSLVGREGFRAARNRVNAERARWRAEDCLARARAVIDERLTAAPGPSDGSRVWRTLDTAVTNATLVGGARCTVRMRAAGTRVDLNGSAEELMRALMGLPDGAAAASARLDAVLDWRDADTVPRPLGAEAGWYAAEGRHVPRDDSIADVRELARIRGFEALPRATLDSLFGADPARISIANAPAAVLLAVPGFTEETVDRILEWRARGVQVTDLLALGGSLSRVSADSMLARFPDIARLTALEPEAWLVTGVGTSGLPADTVRIELRVVRGKGRAATVRRRSWQ